MKLLTANARPALAQASATGRQAAGAAGRHGLVAMAMAALVCLALALAGLAAQPGQAHAALKAAASSAIKTYTISSGNTQVYSNTGLTKKYGTIYGSDEVKVLSVTDKYCRVNYPVRGGTKTGYVRTSAILTKTTGSTYTSRAKITSYRRPGGASYGYIAKGDAVKVLGTSGSYTQVKYPVSGGYKYAFITTSNYNSYIKPVSAPTTTPTVTTGSTAANVQQRLNMIANGTLRYNNSTVMKLNCRFTGTRASEQCKGFAKNVFYLCFKITPSSTQNKPYNYLISNTAGMTRVGYYSNINATQAKTLYSKARPGDFVQIRRSGGGSHSAIVYSVSSSGITFFEANTDGMNTVTMRAYSWAQLASQNAGMSLYTASNYALR